jgi:hypothetical protein
MRYQRIFEKISMIFLLIPNPNSYSSRAEEAPFEGGGGKWVQIEDSPIVGAGGEWVCARISFPFALHV